MHKQRLRVILNKQCWSLYWASDVLWQITLPIALSLRIQGVNCMFYTLSQRYKNPTVQKHPKVKANMNPTKWWIVILTLNSGYRFISRIVIFASQFLFIVDWTLNLFPFFEFGWSDSLFSCYTTFNNLPLKNTMQDEQLKIVTQREIFLWNVVKRHNFNLKTSHFNWSKL